MEPQEFSVVLEQTDDGRLRSTLDCLDVLKIGLEKGSIKIEKDTRDYSPNQCSFTFVVSGFFNNLQ